MKQILAFILLLFFGFGMYAQEYVPSTFVDKSTCNKRSWKRSGFFIGIEGDYAQIEGADALFLGAKLGYVHQSTLDIGLAGKVFASELNRPGISQQPITVTGSYGGLYVSPQIPLDQHFRIGLPMTVGAGAVGYTDKSIEDILEHGHDDIEDWEVIYVFEPGVDLVFALSGNFHLEMGASYRFVRDVDFDTLGKVDIDGWSGGISFKFGIL